MQVCQGVTLKGIKCKYRASWHVPSFPDTPYRCGMHSKNVTRHELANHQVDSITNDLASLQIPSSSSVSQLKISNDLPSSDTFNVFTSYAFVRGYDTKKNGLAWYSAYPRDLASSSKDLEFEHLFEVYRAFQKDEEDYMKLRKTYCNKYTFLIWEKERETIEFLRDKVSTGVCVCIRGYGDDEKYLHYYGAHSLPEGNFDEAIRHAYLNPKFPFTFNHVLAAIINLKPEDYPWN